MLIFTLFFIAAVSGKWWDWCGENERFMHCQTGCERRCGDNLTEPCDYAANQNCLIFNKCECTIGYVRGPNGCIRPEDCPDAKN